jgi:hypothetical protein
MQAIADYNNHERWRTYLSWQGAPLFIMKKPDPNSISEEQDRQAFSGRLTAVEVESSVDPARDAPRRQHYYFVHQYLRERGEQNPRLLIENLRKESGTSYLRFLWVSRGTASKREEDDFISADGLECSPIEIGDEYYGALVQFPTPKKTTEAYFAAIILPVDQTVQTRAKFFTLEFSLFFRPNKTVLGQWAEAAHLNLGSGPLPDKNEFISELT